MSGSEASCGTDGRGAIHCWGNSRDERLQAPDGQFRGVSFDSRQGCAIDPGGDVECWGDVPQPPF